MTSGTWRRWAGSWTRPGRRLWAIVRPGPYICAEWENGGLPHWLKGHARTSDEVYLGQVERWFRRLLPQVVERQIDRGGPVIMVQAENEYGSYGSDAAYLLRLAELLRAEGHGAAVHLGRP